ncbi:CRE-SRA-38 protein, partial [Aphelenchoides avenae]
IILANVLVLYAFVSLVILVGFARIQLMYRIYDHPCDLLVPAWMSAAVRGPIYLYICAFPMCHLTLTIERGWATVKRQHYEKNTSPIFGIVASAAVWLFSASYMWYVVGAAYADPSFTAPFAYYAITRATNADFIIAAHWAFLGVDVLTSVADVTLMFYNRRSLNRVSPGYSLSRTYQTNENVHVTMYLALPLDVCNASVFFICLMIGTVTRYFMVGMSPQKFAAIMDGIHALLVFQAIMSLAIFARFCEKAKKATVVIDPTAEIDLYFELFQKQIA